MEDPSYEPMLDSKWAIPFVAVLLLLIVTILGLLRVGMMIAQRTADRRPLSKNGIVPVLPEPKISVAAGPEPRLHKAA
jgi:hypothetical protein